jgi:hypothetical protein
MSQEHDVELGHDFEEARQERDGMSGPDEATDAPECEPTPDAAHDELDAIAPGKPTRELLSAYLQVWRVEKRVRCVNRLGWYGESYVLPDEALGQLGKSVLQSDAALEPEMGVSGTWEE